MPTTAYFQNSMQARGSHQREIRVQQKLYVKKLSRRNSGNYTCYGQVEGTNKIGQNVTNTLNLEDIWGQEDAIVDIEDPTQIPPLPDYYLEHQLNPPRRIEWVLTVFAHPKPVYQWFGPTGKEIDYINLGKYEVKPSETSIHLIINQATIDDMGEYTFKVKTENNGLTASQNVSLQLIIIKEPEVEHNNNIFSSTVFNIQILSVI